MTLPAQIILILLIASYLLNGWQSWVIMGLTSPRLDFDMLKAPYGVAQRAAFYTVLLLYIVSWPIWMAVGRYSVWRERRATGSRATGFTKP